MSDTETSPENEITAAARHHKQRREAAAETSEPGRKRVWPLASIGLGIGSAALGAAFLYGGKRKKG